MVMANRTVLIADDSQTVRVLTQRALRTAGFEVLLAENGQEAVALADLHRPQIIILDIQMPVMGGYEACDRILRLAHNSPQLRIIFLTSERGQQLDQLGRQYGAYLPKPFNEENLLSTIHGLYGNSNVAGESCSSITSGIKCGDSEHLSLCSK
jgi:CheY-like chemotaxis protein